MTSTGQEHGMITPVAHADAANNICRSNDPLCTRQVSPVMLMLQCTWNLMLLPCTRAVASIEAAAAVIATNVALK